MNRHLLFFAAFSPEAQEGLCAVLKIVFDSQVNRRANPRTGISERCQERLVPVTDEVACIDRDQKRTNLLSAEGRRLTFRSGELGRLDFASRIDWQNAFLGEPGEEHPDPAMCCLIAAGEPGCCSM
jgi:hypothetical protein